MNESSFPIMIHPIFITPVLELSEKYKFSTEELEYIKTLPIKENEKNHVSKLTNVLNDTKMKNIKTYIEKGIKYYVDTILCPINNDLEIYITESWCNYTSTGQSHHRHSHHNSIISGCLYIDVDKESDKIHFYNDNLYRRIQIDVDEKKCNNFNSKSWWLPIENGKLIIFDSSLDHSVEEVRTNHTRISLSFNTFFRGEIGSDTTRLKLN